MKVMLESQGKTTIKNILTLENIEFCSDCVVLKTTTFLFLFWREKHHFIQLSWLTLYWLTPAI